MTNRSPILQTLVTRYQIKFQVVREKMVRIQTRSFLSLKQRGNSCFLQMICFVLQGSSLKRLQGFSAGSSDGRVTDRQRTIRCKSGFTTETFMFLNLTLVFLVPNWLCCFWFMSFYCFKREGKCVKCFFYHTFSIGPFHLSRFWKQNFCLFISALTLSRWII